MKKNRIGLPLILLSTILMIGAFSCKKYYDPPPVFEQYRKDSMENQRKVLIISIDGVSGRSLKVLQPPHISRLMQHGKYSYDVAPLPVSTNASSWVTMLTGIPYSEHQIKDSSFQFNLEGGLSHENEDLHIPYYPPFFNYILPLKPKMTIAAITPWQNLSDYLALLNYSIAVPNDEAVKDTAVALLKKLTPLGLMVVDLNEVDIAGHEGIPSIADFDYRTAVMNADKKVGEIVSALRSRKNYEKEDWLVIVTTNRAGTVENPKPGFIVINNPRLNKEEVHKTGFNTINFQGTGDDAVIATVPNDNGLYNFGADEDFTVQLQAKFNTNTSYPAFFSKSAGWSGWTQTGWCFVQAGDQLAIFDGGSDNGGSGRQQPKAPGIIGDGRWHTLTLTMTMENGVRTGRIFIDGNMGKSFDATSRGSFDTPAPLTLGKVPLNGAADFYAADVEIFNVALPPDTVKKYIDLKNINEHPYYDNLIGYWPINEGAGSVIHNLAPTGYDMVLQGPFDWSSLGNDVPVSVNEVPDLRPSVTPSPLDINALVFYWLQIEKDTDWGMKGNPWVSNYEDELYNL